ncbi:MAG: cytochrome c oxidase subunit 3 family protein [Deltaproteobacteria bacterium]|nr:cytochrome c oxidase subunit 3 family protein [Deltaproteobacteria bacterium]
MGPTEHAIEPADFPLAEHFSDPEQQLGASKLGMWLFLATEVLLFGGLFCAYVVFRSLHPAAFAECHELLDWKLGALNTVILLISSLTVALSIRSAQLGHRTGIKVNLALTILCACAFLFFKWYFEWPEKFAHGYLPGYHFVGDVKDPDQAHIFFGLYFLMTGLHAAHVVIGIGVLGWLLWRTQQGHFGSSYWQPLELGGLYWHIVDVIWIFLFPLFYLAG